MDFSPFFDDFHSFHFQTLESHKLAAGRRCQIKSAGNERTAEHQLIDSQTADNRSGQEFMVIAGRLTTHYGRNRRQLGSQQQVSMFTIMKFQTFGLDFSAKLKSDFRRDNQDFFGEV